MGFISLKAEDGSALVFDSRYFAQGAVKDVHLSRDGAQVVAFYRKLRAGTPAYAAAKARLEKIVGTYRKRIFEMEGGDFWRGLYCWAERIVVWGDRLGFVAPLYPKRFFFEYGAVGDDKLQIRGKEKESKWFSSAQNRFHFLDMRERGNLQQWLLVCLNLCRALRRLHAAGLAHGDLSYKNVLADPLRGSIYITDIDGLVVPDLFVPEVLGSPDFIAPEVLATQHFSVASGRRVLPSRQTDLHALAVLLYMYLLCRHPLRGRKIHDLQDERRDELLSMGAGALFVEHPQDASNRPDVSNLSAGYLPWGDVEKLPYSILGERLRALFERAFVQGLHRATERVSADEWERAFVQTLDLLLPCAGKACPQQWFVYMPEKARQVCPYCDTVYPQVVPLAEFFLPYKEEIYLSDGWLMSLYNPKNLYLWHINSRFFPNEKISGEERKPVADFQQLNGRWYFINRRLGSAFDMSRARPIAINSAVELQNGLKIRLDEGENARIMRIRLPA